MSECAKRWGGIGMIVMVVASVSFAQAPRPTGPGDFKLRDIDKQLVVAADVLRSVTGQSTPSTSMNKKWLRIEVRFDSVPEWADDVQLKYFVLMGRGNDAKMFAGELTLINVQKGSNHYAAMFMHPNTVERYGRGKVEAVAVQLFHQNRLIDQLSDPSTTQRWWERFSPITGVLLAPHYTPWALGAHERYEAVKY